MLTYRNHKPDCQCVLCTQLRDDQGHEWARNVAKRLALGLGFPTTETRNSDQLDFRDVHVAALMRALEEAFIAGMKAGKNA